LAQQDSRGDGTVPPRRRGYPEVTIASVSFGVIFGAILNAAITYSGLKIGFTITGSAVAAVVGFGVLRGILRRGTIQEVNIGQTIASAVNTPGSGVIFTVPVLFLMGLGFGLTDPSFWLVAAACVAGAVLGVAFIIPIRKQMIDIDRIRFPSGTAVAAILKSPGAGPAKSVVLGAGVVLGALIYLPAGLPDIRLNADVAALDALVARGAVTAENAASTRRIARWIESRAAPADVVAHGHALLEARSRGDRLELAGPSGVSRELAVAAAEATDGQRAWESLRDRRLGWATRPLWGFSDLDLRLPMPAPAAEGDTQDQRRFQVEMSRVDRDGDGRPDLVLTKDKVNAGRAIGLPDQIELIFAIAPFAFGAGFLSGRAGLFVLAGGVLAYFLLNPVAFALGWMPETVRAADAPNYAFGAFNRPLGIGLLLGGAAMGIVASLPSIREALRSIAKAGARPGGSDELGLKWLIAAIFGAFVLLLVASELIHGMKTEPEAAAGGLLGGLPPLARHAIVALVGVAWMWFAGIIISQCSGMTDWSPISGMALLTVVLVLALAGNSDVQGAVLIGAALCVAVTCASDMMHDLKTGHLVGGIPKRQQAAELITAALGPIISLGVLMIIVAANTTKMGGGPGIGPGTDTTAPQAQALQAVIEGVQGGNVPYALYAVGSLLGIGLGVGVFPGLGVLVGISMYLPFHYILTYGLGCLANMFLGRLKGRIWAEDWGVPLCAGLIVGEALLALVINITVLGMG